MTDITQRKQAERVRLKVGERAEHGNRVITEKNRELELLASDLCDKDP